MNFGAIYNGVLGHKLARDEVILFFYVRTHTRARARASLVNKSGNSPHIERKTRVDTTNERDHDRVRIRYVLQIRAAEAGGGWIDYMWNRKPTHQQEFSKKFAYIMPYKAKTNGKSKLRHYLGTST